MSDPNLTDVVLAQAQMIAFATPVVGPGIAAIVSIGQAIYDGLNRAAQQPPDYSVAKAIDDLAARVDRALADFATEAQYNTIEGWGLKRNDFSADILNWGTTGNKNLANLCEAFFLNDDNFDTVFAALGDTASDPGGGPAAPVPVPPKQITRQQVQELGLYTLARTSYQGLCQVALQLLARSKDLSPQTQYLAVHSPIRTRFENSLQRAIDHLTPISASLDDFRTNGVAKAQATAAAKADPSQNPIAYNAAFTAAYRQLRADSFIDASTPAIADRCKAIIDVYQDTLTLMQRQPLPANTPTPAAGGLGPRAPKTSRFLFEQGTSDWYPVLADSQVSGGSLASQDAGSSDSKIYYQVGGCGVNGQFDTALTASTGLSDANAALVTEYEKKYGTGSWKPDAAAARTDRLTSLLVPLTPAGPVGSTVYAMVYTVGPKLSGPITDEAGYKQLYLDALTEIADWNLVHPSIDNFRVTMVSCGIYGGAAVMDRAAALIVDAVLESLGAQPLLADLTILVNSNEVAGGAERLAFTKAAAAKNVTATMQGFDLPLT